MVRQRIARVNASLASRSALRGIDPRDPLPKCRQSSTRPQSVRGGADYELVQSAGLNGCASPWRRFLRAACLSKIDSCDYGVTTSGLTRPTSIDATVQML